MAEDFSIKDIEQHPEHEVRATEFAYMVKQDIIPNYPDLFIQVTVNPLSVSMVDKLAKQAREKGDLEEATDLQDIADSIDIESANQSEVDVAICGNSRKQIVELLNQMDKMATSIEGVRMNGEVRENLKLPVFVTPDNPKGYINNMVHKSDPRYLFKVQ